MWNRRGTALILAGLSALGPFSVDTYFPSFPAMAAHFGVSELRVQSTLTYYLLALATMNLFHGALSDSFGRRRVIQVALGIYSATAFLCAIATDFSWLLAFRVMQGLSAGVGLIVSRAIIRDRFAGGEAQRFMAQVTMVGGLAPAVAPIVGGALHIWFGWRGPFVFLGILGLCLNWLCHVGLSESLPVSMRHPFHPATLARGYVRAATQPTFVLLCASLACAGGGFLLYVATAPDVVINILGLSETQFGWMFVPIVTGFIAGAAVTSKIAGRVPGERAVAYGFALMAVAAAFNVIYSWVATPRVPWAVLPLGVYTLGFSLFAPVATIQGLDLLPDRKGLASSLQGFAQVLLFALISNVGAVLVYRSALRHALGMGAMTLLSVLLYVAAHPIPGAARTHDPAAARH